MTTPACDYQELHASAGWQRIDFLSDLHLQASTPRTAAALISHLRSTPAQAVIILGDLFEAWVGDELRMEGMEREVCAALKAAAQTKWVGFMAGNRDFLIGLAFAHDCQVHLLHDPTLLITATRRVLLTHGDLLCTADTAYQAFRLQVRDPAWQAHFLSLDLAERKRMARQMRDASQAAQRHPEMASIGDVDDQAVSAWMQAARADLMIHGHTHRPALHRAGGSAQRAVLSDWDLDGVGAARGDVLALSNQGLERLRPDA